jgi:hypothetical protein
MTPTIEGGVMRAVIVYESMFGNTHQVAEHIAIGLRRTCDVVVTPVDGADEASLATADLLVVGGPTHVHGMSSATSRKAAVDQAAKEEDLELDPDAEGPGLRNWFDELTAAHGSAAAAFDTRIDASPLLTGRASKGIGKRLRHHGYDLVVEPTSFLVDKQNHLIDGEADRAETWGASLGAILETRVSEGTVDTRS